MLKPSDFNNAVPQFQNGNYASNPVNPQYIAEPSSTEYNRGAEPLQTLPAQWWNWFMNKFTSRFNKVNIYVKNIFNELSELLGVVQLSPDGTEGSPTISQLKTMFCSCYPNFIRDSSAIADTYVKQTTTVNGHALSGDVSVTRDDLGLGTVATLNTGTASGCVPLVGSAMGTTNNNIVVTDVNGKLKPSGTVIGSAAGYDCSCFRPSTWTPSSVTCASTISRTGYTDAYNFDILLTNGSSTANGTTPYVSNKCRLQFCSTTGVLSAVCFNGLATRAGYATCLYNRPGSVANGLGNVYFYTGCTNASCVASNFGACICGANGCLYGIGGINLDVVCTTGCKSVAIGSSACTDGWSIYGCVGGSDQYNLIMNLTDDGSNYVGFACSGTVKSYICGSNGTFYGNVQGSVTGLASCASCNGSGVAFGDSATKGVFGRTDVGDIGWGTTANQSKVVQVCAIAYWNGAYTGTSSNLKYYCGGAFGSAAGKNAGNASGNVPLVGTALSTIDNIIVLTDANGKLKPSPYTIGNSAYKTAGSAVGNVPVVGTPLGTTNGQLVATDASGKLKPSGYTASSFLGATAKACCSVTADYATYLSKTTSNVTCAIYISSANDSIVCIKASCGNGTRNLMVDCALCATCAQNAWAIIRYPAALCIRCVKISNYVCVYCMCNRCSFPILFVPSIGNITECEMSYICSYIGRVIPASAEYCLGTYSSCIGQWSTCYPGIRVV